MDALEKLTASFGFPAVALPDSAAGSMESAIRFLVNRLVEGGWLHKDAAEGAIRAILGRERLGSTALGNGFASPHSISTAVDRVIGIVAYSASPVPWETPDGIPVEIICMTLASVGRPGSQLRVLQEIERVLWIRRVWET